MESQAVTSEKPIQSAMLASAFFGWLRREARRRLAARSCIRWSVVVISMFLAVGSLPAGAQAVQFFGAFQSYTQGFAQNAQGLVANAQGAIYVSGSHALGYVPVDVNGVPIEADEVGIPGPSQGHVMGMAIDSSNNIFRADPEGPSGPTVEMFTNLGSPTSFNLSYIGAGWVEPTSVTVDSSSNVYVLDGGTGAIVELTPDGMGGYTQSTLYTNADLVNTTGLSMDSAGNFYVASGSDYGAYPLPAPAQTAVYMITNNHDTTYTLSTIGSGWQSPSATTVDAAGNIWVVDYLANTINLLVPAGGGTYNQTVYQDISQIRTLMVNQAGRIYGFAYNGADALIWTGGTPPHNLGTYNVGTAATASTITVDFMNGATAGGFAVSSQGASTGEFLASGGTCAPGIYGVSQSCTIQVTFTPQAPGMRAAALVVTDSNNHVLGTNYLYGVGVAPSIAFAPGVFSTVVPNGSGLIEPFSSALDQGGNLFVTDYVANTLYKFAAGTAPAIPVDSTLNQPAGVTVDGAGNLWVAECAGGDIVLETLTGPGTYAKSVAFSGLNCPYGVALDGSGNVYVVESGAGDVLKETLTNGTFAQSTVISGLSNPASIAVDSSSNVYVADTGHNQVLEETPSNGSYQQTIVANSGLSSPAGLAIDPNGNVYVSDSGNGRVLKETLSGGTFTSSTLQSAGMLNPAGLSLDPAGNLYILDETNNSIDQLNVSVPPSLAFADTVAGSESSDSPKTTTVYNYGNAVLNIGTISIPAGFANDASTCALSTQVLAPDAGCLLQIDFVPSSGVPYGTTVGLADNNLNVPSTQYLSVNGTGLPDVILSPVNGTLLSATVGAAFSQSFTAAGGVSPYTYTVSITSGALPTGLSFSGGVLSGTPSSSGSVSFTIAAADSSSFPGPFSSNVQSYTLTVTPAPVISIAPGSLPNGVVGIAYSQTISASGGDGSYAYAVTSGSLPPGVSLNGGVLSGIATAAGPYVFTITATDTLTNMTASQGYAVTMYPVASAALAKNAGASNIGGTASVTTLTFTFNVAATVANVQVVTQGVSNKDFADAGTGSCTSTAYGATNTCTVDVAFIPQAAGIRNGAVLLEDAAGDVLGTGYVTGIGTGPQITFQPGTESMIAGAQAPFNLATPAGVAVDAGGNVYIADHANGAVYKETLSAGNFTQSTIAALSSVTGVALDGAGNVYIAQAPSSSVYKETPTGSSNNYTQTLISSNAGSPSGLAVDGSGDVFIADAAGSVIYELTLSAGSYIQSTIISSGLSQPQGIAVDANSNVYVADQNNRQVWKETYSAGVYTPTAISSGVASPEGVLLDGSGNVYISDYGTGQILKETWTGGTYVQTVVPTGSPMTPSGMAMDAAGNLYVVDVANTRVMKEDYADLPSLSFANVTNVGSADTENPATFTLINSGNAPLTFTVPASGINPAIANASFTLDSSSSCVPVSAGGTSVALAAGTNCTYAVDFTPQASGPNAGSLTLYDNNLNNTSAEQAIALLGTGVSSVITLAPAGGLLSSGTVAIPYNQTFIASGGVGPYSFTWSGTLPAGLALSTTGVLAGVPTTAGGPWSFRVTATDTVGGGQVSQDYTVSVTPAAATVTLSGLTQTYTGSPLAATATTSPTSLTVSLTYNGSPTAPTAAGTYAVVGTISDPNYTGTASGTMTIDKATAIVNLSSLTKTYTGAPLAATATTSPGSLSVSLTYNGSSTPPTGAGTYAVVGTISDENYAGTASGEFLISPAVTAISVAASANPAVLMNAVALTATLTSGAGIPSGQASFFDGTTLLGSAAVTGGVATFTTATLAAGAHSITAVFAGGADYTASSTSPIVLTVVDLSLGNTGSGGNNPGQTQTTTAGGTASYTVALAPSAGTTFPLPITLTIAALPAGATASLDTQGWMAQSPVSWILPANEPVSNLSLTVHVPSQIAAAKRNDGPARKLPLVAMSFLLLPFLRNWRKTGRGADRLLCFLLLAVGMASAMSVMGCGSASIPPQTYNVTVTTTAGALVHTTQLTLTVQ